MHLETHREPFSYISFIKQGLEVPLQITKPPNKRPAVDVFRHIRSVLGMMIDNLLKGRGPRLDLRF